MNKPTPSPRGGELETVVRTQAPLVGAHYRVGGRSLFSIAVGCLMHLNLLAQAQTVDPLKLDDGDRVAFLGNSFFEHALDHDHIETTLALRWAEKNIVFRNLGWDGDTVYGHSRAGGRRRAVFGDPEEGFRIMVDHVRSLEPTVVFVAYGFNESFKGKQGIEPFRKRLLRLLSEITRNSAKIVLLSPPPMENGFGASRPYIAERNKILGQYRSVISEITKSGNHQFVDLFDLLKMKGDRYSDNGIHPSGEGYRAIADIIAKQLRMPDAKIDPASEGAEKIRSAIINKNALFFHRWRPRNDAFVYGERKDEQKIAQSEPAQFERAIARQERVIREMLNSATR